MEMMLKDYEPKIYNGFSPNDKAIRIFQKDLNKYIEEGWVKYHFWPEKIKEKLLEKITII